MKRIKVCAVVLVLLLAVSGLTYASTEMVKVFNNRIETSGLNVHIDLMRETDGGLKQIDSETVLTSGRAASFIPQVRVTGRDSYVRLRLEARNNDGDVVKMNPGSVYGMNDEWVRRGDWFYCQRALGNGQSSAAFKGIKLPSFGGKESCGFVTSITADAIQAENFNPDFNSDAPWGDVSIQVSQADGSETPKGLSSAKNTKMILKDDGTIDCPESDLFSGFGRLVPGDTQEDSLTITNESGKDTSLYFRTKNNRSDVLENARLVIDCDGRNIYDGSLTSEELDGSICIADLKSGEDAQVRYKVSLPKTADNEFQKAGDTATWIFEARQDGRPTYSHAVKTGDRWGTGLIFALAICTLALLILMTLALKRGRHEKDS